MDIQTHRTITALLRRRRSYLGGEACHGVGPVVISTQCILLLVGVMSCHASCAWQRIFVSRCRCCCAHCLSVWFNPDSPPNGVLTLYCTIYAGPAAAQIWRNTHAMLTATLMKQACARLLCDWFERLHPLPAILLAISWTPARPGSGPSQQYRYVLHAPPSSCNIHTVLHHGHLLKLY